MLLAVGCALLVERVLLVCVRACGKRDEADTDWAGEEMETSWGENVIMICDNNNTQSDGEMTAYARTCVNLVLHLHLSLCR